MNLKWIAVGVVLGVAPLWSGGAMAGLRAYALPELEEMALKTHPSLQVSGAEIKKSEAELRIARQYPNPEVEGSVSSQKGLESGTMPRATACPVPDPRVAGTPGQKTGVRPLRHRCG